MDDQLDKEANNKPHNSNPTGKGGFGDNPQNINREGRPPREFVISDQLLDMAKKDPELVRAVAAKMWELAKRGELSVIREVMDRLEGKPIQPTAEIPEDRIDDFLHIYKPEKNETK